MIIFNDVSGSYTFPATRTKGKSLPITAVKQQEFLYLLPAYEPLIHTYQLFGETVELFHTLVEYVGLSTASSPM